MHHRVRARGHNDEECATGDWLAHIKIHDHSDGHELGSILFDVCLAVVRQKPNDVVEGTGFTSSLQQE